MNVSNCIVAIACFVINLIILGSGRMSSVYYVECMIRYNANREDASFPFVLSFLMRTTLGPLIGFFGRKYGLKETTIFGCFLCSMGIAACFFAEDIRAIKVFWGFLFGLGFGFSTALLPVILTNLYEKHQTRANGFALAGACLGGIILPPALQSLIQYYGTSGSFLLLACIVLHSIPTAMLLENPKRHLNAPQVFYDDEMSMSSKSNHSFPVSCAIASKNETKKADILHKSMQFSSTCSDTDTNKVTGINESNCSNNWDIAKGNTYVISQEILRSEQGVNETHLTGRSTMKFKKDVNCSNDKKEIEMCCTNFIKKIKTILETFSVLSNPVFIVIAIVQSTFAFISVTCLTVLVDFVRDKNIANEAEAYFVMCFSLFDFIGHVSLGFVTDRRFMSRTNYAVLCFFLLGISCVVMNLSTNFALLMFGVCLFGLMCGAVFVVFPGIIHEFVDLNHQTIAMCSGCVLYAPLSFATSPLIGYVRETLGSYKWLFHILAFASILCSGLSCLVPCLAKKKKLPKICKEEN